MAKPQAPTFTPFRVAVDRGVPVDHERVCLAFECDDGADILELPRDGVVCWSVHVNTSRKLREELGRGLSLNQCVKKNGTPEYLELFVQNHETQQLVSWGKHIFPTINADVLSHHCGGGIPLRGAITHIRFKGQMRVEAFVDTPPRAGPEQMHEVYLDRFYTLNADRATGLVDLSAFDGYAVGLYVAGDKTLRLDDTWGWPVIGGEYFGYEVLPEVMARPHLANGHYKLHGGRRLWTDADYVFVWCKEPLDPATGLPRKSHLAVRPREDATPVTQVGDNEFVEGYWFDLDNAVRTRKYPFPVEASQQEYDQPERAAWRERFQHVLGNFASLCDAEVVHFMGASTSRLTQESVGCLEYVAYDDAGNKWRFPEGLRHYYLDHRVLPSPEFARVVDYWHGELLATEQ